MESEGADEGDTALAAACRLLGRSEARREHTFVNGAAGHGENTPAGHGENTRVVFMRDMGRVTDGPDQTMA